MKIKKDFMKVPAIGDSFVVVPLGNTSTDKNWVVELNETAALIYDYIEQGLNEQAICDKLVAEYDVDLQSASHDVRDVIDQLSSAGILEN